MAGRGARARRRRALRRSAPAVVVVFVERGSSSAPVQHSGLWRGRLLAAAVWTARALGRVVTTAIGGLLAGVGVYLVESLLHLH